MLRLPWPLHIIWNRVAIAGVLLLTCVVPDEDLGAEWDWERP